MSSFEALKQTFFEECSEALQQIELGLAEIRDGSGSADTINAVFRSVHSVKGGAGIFGFEDLVKFAHVFETVLDAMRSETLSATQEIVDTLLQANDVLSDLIAMSRSGEAIPPAYGSECRAALDQIMRSEVLGGQTNSGADETAPTDFDGLDFVPVPADQLEEPVAPSDGHEYRIVFRPQAELLRKANEPLFILRELREFGALDVTVETDRLPDLAEIEPDRPYLGWICTLRTAAPPERIDEVFEFVVGDCELEITLAESASEAFSQGLAVETSIVPDVGPLPGDALPLPSAPLQESILQPLAKPSVEQTGAMTPRPTVGKPPAAGATTTRVELEKIDRVVNMVGELVISQAMLGQVVHSLPEDVSGRLLQVLEEVIHHTRELKDSVMSMRAQQVGAVFQRMPRLVRELAGKTSKKVRLEMSGESTEVDRSIIERLGDPLTHIIRNSIDHGIELPYNRIAAGKSEEGTIRLSAEHRGGRIVIQISDDGAGLNAERVLNKARERGLVGNDANLSEDEINNLIFLPGFSTAEKVSDISGRGVGMDVVRRNIQDVGGRISLKSDRGRGMMIQLSLPLTLAVMDGMVVRVGHQIYVMPMSAIVECLRPPTSDIHNLIGTSGMLRLRGNLLPIVQLRELLDIAPDDAKSDERVVVISDAGEGAHFGIVVDELCGHQQVVVKSIEQSYGSVTGIAGATILGNGRVSFILDVEKLSELASSPGAETGTDRRAGRASKMASAVN